MQKIIGFIALIGIAIGIAWWSMEPQDEAQQADAVSSDPLKVGFVYLTNPGDHGWTYAHEVGRQDLQAHFGDKIETNFVENVAEGPDAARVIRELVEQGNEVIFTTSFGYMDPTLKVSKEFPNVKFHHITGYKLSLIHI